MPNPQRVYTKSSQHDNTCKLKMKHTNLACSIFQHFPAEGLEYINNFRHTFKENRNADTYCSNSHHRKHCRPIHKRSTSISIGHLLNTKLARGSPSCPTTYLKGGWQLITLLFFVFITVWERGRDVKSHMTIQWFSVFLLLHKMDVYEVTPQPSIIFRCKSCAVTCFLPGFNSHLYPNNKY